MAVEVRTPRSTWGRHRRPELPPRPDPVHGRRCLSVKVIKAGVPLSEMFGYIGELRSRTQGRAVFTMTFESYAEVPKAVAEEIIEKSRGE